MDDYKYPSIPLQDLFIYRESKDFPSLLYFVSPHLQVLPLLFRPSGSVRVESKTLERTRSNPRGHRDTEGGQIRGTGVVSNVKQKLQTIQRTSWVVRHLTYSRPLNQTDPKESWSSFHRTQGTFHLEPCSFTPTPQTYPPLGSSSPSSFPFSLSLPFRRVSPTHSLVQ